MATTRQLPTDWLKNTGYTSLANKYQTNQPISYTGRQILNRAGVPTQGVTPMPISRQMPNIGQAGGMTQPMPQGQDLYTDTLNKMKEKYGITDVSSANLFKSQMRQPQQLAATPGFSNMTLQGAEGIQGIKANGQGRMMDILGQISEERRVNEEKRIKAEKELAEEKQKTTDKIADDLQKRRTTAITQFQQLREEIGKKGLPLDPVAGYQFLEQLQTSDNPEKVLQDYYVAAFNVPAVRQSFLPVSLRKKTGGGVTSKKTTTTKKILTPTSSSEDLF